MDNLPVSPFAQSLVEWETMLQIMQMIVATGVFLFFAVAIGAILWLATHQHQEAASSEFRVLRTIRH
jgi:hypothetical protein